MAEYTIEQLEAADALLAEQERDLTEQRDAARRAADEARSRQDELVEPYRVVIAARKEIARQVLVLQRGRVSPPPEGVDVTIASAVASASASANPSGG